MAQCDEDSVFKDNVMAVRYVPIFKQSYSPCESSQDESDAELSTGKRDSEVDAVVEQVKF